ncbi:MAG: hypothetical protein R3E84_04625 [Pseudomonadales bacterium]
MTLAGRREGDGTQVLGKALRGAGILGDARREITIHHDTSVNAADCRQ